MVMVESAKVTVLGADGFVGAGLAAELNARRVVYGAARNGDVPIADAARTLGESEIIINAGGFRVRPGCRYSDYQRSHQGAASVLVPLIPKNACLIHISSASVLGKSRDKLLGSKANPDPESFPSSSYASAKLEADRFLMKASESKGFRLILIRPAVVYSPQGAGMMDTLLKLARRGVLLRLFPARARHHFCHMRLLADVVRRVTEREKEMAGRCFVVADPYTVSNRELEKMFKRYQRKSRLTVPVPVHWLHKTLRHTFHSTSPLWDLKTWGEIFGVLNLDTEYDPSDTFCELELNPADYSIEKTLQPFIRESLAT